MIAVNHQKGTETHDDERGEQGAIPVVENSDDISLIIAGGDLHIPQHAYLPTWGFPPCRITRTIRSATTN